jgi:hypothetical protein
MPCSVSDLSPEHGVSLSYGWKSLGELWFSKLSVGAGV